MYSHHRRKFVTCTIVVESQFSVCPVLCRASSSEVPRFRSLQKYERTSQRKSDYVILAADKPRKKIKCFGGFRS